MRTFAGQHAVLTGASGGIGAACADLLAARGAGLSLLGRDAHRLAACRDELLRRYPDAHVALHVIDLETAGADEHARIAAQLGPVDLLVHCAGIMSLERLEATTAAAFDAQLNTNLRAPFLLTRALLPALRARQGQIAFVNSSVAQQTARASLGVYAASKYALRALADALRDEVNDDGVRVISVYPGRTASRMQEAVHAFEAKPYRPELLLQPADVAATLVDALALPRSAEVTDVSIRPFRKS